MIAMPYPLKAEVWGLKKLRALTNLVRCLSKIFGRVYVAVEGDRLLLVAPFGEVWGYAVVPSYFFSYYEYLGREPRYLDIPGDFLGRVLARFEEDGEKPVKIETDEGELYVYREDLELRKFTLKTAEITEEWVPRDRIERIDREFVPIAGFILYERVDKKVGGLRGVLADLSKAFREEFDEGGLEFKEGRLLPTYGRRRWVSPVDIWTWVEKGEGISTPFITRGPAFKEFRAELTEEVSRLARDILTSLGRYYGKEILMDVGRVGDHLVLRTEWEGIWVTLGFPAEWPDIFPWEVPRTPKETFAIKVEPRYEKFREELLKVYHEGVIDYETYDDVREWCEGEIKGLAEDVELGRISVEEALREVEEIIGKAREKAKIVAPPPAVPPPPPKLSLEEFRGRFDEILQERLGFMVELLSPGLRGEIRLIAPERVEELVARFTVENIKDRYGDEIEAKFRELWETYERAYEKKPEYGERILREEFPDILNRFARSLADKKSKELIEEAKKPPVFRPEEYEAELRDYAVKVAVDVGLSREDAERLLTEIWSDVMLGVREARSLEEAKEIVRRMVEPEAWARIPVPVPPPPPRPPVRPPGAMTKADIVGLRRWFEKEFEGRFKRKVPHALFREVEEILKDAYRRGLTRREASRLLIERLEKWRPPAPPPPPPPPKPYLPPKELWEICGICGRRIEPGETWSIWEGRRVHYSCLVKVRGW